MIEPTKNGRLRPEDPVEVTLDRPRRLQLTLGDIRRWTREFQGEQVESTDAVLALLKAALVRDNPDVRDMSLDELGDLVPIGQVDYVAQQLRKLRGGTAADVEAAPLAAPSEPVPAVETEEETVEEDPTGSTLGALPGSSSASTMTSSGT